MLVLFLLSGVVFLAGVESGRDVWAMTTLRCAALWCEKHYCGGGADGVGRRSVPCEQPLVETVIAHYPSAKSAPASSKWLCSSLTLLVPQ